MRISRPARAPRLSPARRAALGVLLVAASVGCTGVKVRRDTPTSGTFTSSAWAFTLVSEDIPRPALMTARANAADIQRPNLRIDSEWVFPDLHWVDWLLDIVGFRYAKVSGSWEEPLEDAATDASATR